MSKFKIGDPVTVMDAGLLMMQQFATKGSLPNNIGQIASKEIKGEYEVWFPIDGDLTYEHSQCSVYHKSELVLRKLLPNEKTIQP